MLSKALMRPLGSTPNTPAQTRVIEAALALFAEHGISGTSLQMIADAIGVTKAAVYHQTTPRTRSCSPSPRSCSRVWRRP
jgi:hypothetical protein